VKTLVQLGKVIQKVAPKAVKQADRAINKIKKEQERKHTYFTGRLKWVAYNCPVTAFTIIENAPSGPCKDDYDLCTAFAEAGKCETHPHLIEHCRLSCNACAERKERLGRKNWRQQDRKEHFFRKNGQYNDPKTVEFKPPKIVATKGSSHYE